MRAKKSLTRFNGHPKGGREEEGGQKGLLFRTNLILELKAIMKEKISCVEITLLKLVKEGEIIPQISPIN